MRNPIIVCLTLILIFIFNFTYINALVTPTRITSEKNLVEITLDSPSSEFSLNVSSLNMNLFDSVVGFNGTEFVEPLIAYYNTTDKTLSLIFLQKVNRVYIAKAGLNNINTSHTGTFFYRVRIPRDLSIENVVRINVSTILSDFGDFVIKDTNDNLLPFCFEQPDGNCNSTKTDIVWVRIPAQTPETEIRIHRSTDTSTSQPKDVFFRDTYQYSQGYGDYYFAVGASSTDYLFMRLSNVLPNNRIIVGIDGIGTYIADRYLNGYIRLEIIKSFDNNADRPDFLNKVLCKSPLVTSGNYQWVIYNNLNCFFLNESGEMNLFWWAVDGYSVRSEGATGYSRIKYNPSGSLIGSYTYSAERYPNYYLYNYRPYFMYLDYFYYIKENSLNNYIIEKVEDLPLVSYSINSYKLAIINSFTNVMNNGYYSIYDNFIYQANLSISNLNSIDLIIKFNSTSLTKNYSSSTNILVNQTFQSIGLNVGWHTLEYVKIYSIINSSPYLEVYDYDNYYHSFKLEELIGKIVYPYEYNINSVSYILIEHSNAEILQKVILDGQEITASCYDYDSRYWRCDLSDEIIKGKHDVYIKTASILNPSVTKEDSLTFYVTDKNYGKYDYWFEAIEPYEIHGYSRDLIIFYNISVNNTYPYKFYIDWGDGIIEYIGEFSENITGNKKHTYGREGLYVVNFIISVEDSQGNSDNISRNIGVFQIPYQQQDNESSSGSSGSGGYGNASIVVTIESPYNEVWEKNINKIVEVGAIILASLLVFIGARNKV